MQIKTTQFKEIVTDKKICVVVPSKAMENKTLGNFIDQFDIVVRLNNGYNFNNKQTADFGKRTDLLYHYLSLPSENQLDYSLYKIKKIETKCLILLPRPESYHFKVFKERNSKVNLPYYKIGEFLRKKIWNEIECLPFCGVWAIYHLLQFPIRELNVFGMNFFETGHYKGYDLRTEKQQIEYAFNSQFDKRGRDKQHKILPQKNFLKKLFETDVRIKLDEITFNTIYE